MTDETALYLRVRGSVVRVAGRSAVFGRSRSCEVQIDERGVSRKHCEVLLKDDGATVRDLGSTHGTWVAGRRADGETRLAAGVLVTLGAHGPHFEVVNAIAHGRPVLGRATDPLPVPDDAEPTALGPSPVPRAATSGRRFLAGLACGFAAGAGLGVAALALWF